MGFNLITIFILKTQEQQCDKKLNNLIQTASNVGERIPVNNSEDFLTAKIKETEKIIK